MTIVASIVFNMPTLNHEIGIIAQAATRKTFVNLLVKCELRNLSPIFDEVQYLQKSKVLCLKDLGFQIQIRE